MQDSVEKPPEILVFKVLKLNNGDTIIARVLIETPTSLDIDMPYKFYSVMNSRGNFNLTVFRWDPTIDYNNPIRLFKNAIVACGDPSPNILESYKEIYNDGGLPEESSADDDDTDDDDGGVVTDDVEELEEKMKHLMTTSKPSKLH